MAFIHSPRVVTDGLVLHLDAANTRSYPRSGPVWNNLIGTDTGSITGTTFNSENNGSLVFDGTNPNFVELGTFSNMGLTDRTYSVWMYISGADTNNRRVINFPQDNTGTDVPAFILTTRSNLGIQVGVGGDPFNGYVVLSPVILNTWINVTATVTSTKTINGYVNGVFAGTATSTGTVATNPIGQIGRYNATFSQRFNGRVAMVSYYNRILSVAEIVSNFNATRSRFGV